MHIPLRRVDTFVLTHDLRFHEDIGGAGSTFLMEGFKIHFGWECASDDPDCVPASSQEISRDQGLINGLLGAGAAMYVKSRMNECPNHWYNDVKLTLRFVLS
jgi:hypothetical protein